jgi:hypothetical protein
MSKQKSRKREASIKLAAQLLQPVSAELLALKYQDHLLHIQDATTVVQRCISAVSAPAICGDIRKAKELMECGLRILARLFASTLESGKNGRLYAMTPSGATPRTRANHLNLDVTRATTQVYQIM